MSVIVDGGQPLNPAQTSYKAYDLAALGNITLSWPFSFLESPYVVAARMQVSGNTNQIMTLPDATEAANGTSFIITNIGGNPLLLYTKNGPSSPGTQFSIAASTSYEFCLTDNTTPDGVWLKVQYGATPGTADASYLAGFGLTTYLAGSPSHLKLETDMPAKFVMTSTYSTLPSDRASLIVIPTGSTMTTFTLVAGIADGFYFSLRNQNTFPFNVVAQSGTINGVASIQMEPGDALEFINTAGDAWYSVGSFGGASSNFTVRRYPLTGASSSITLLPGDYQVSMLYFTGVLTTNTTVYFPQSDRSWVVMNATTSSDPTLTLTLRMTDGAGSGVGNSYVLGRGEVLDFISDPTATTLRKDPDYALGLPTAQGGTGANIPSITTGDLLIGDSTTRPHFNRLGIGASGRALVSLSGAVSWQPAINFVGATDKITTYGPTSSTISLTLGPITKRTATSSLVINGVVSWGAPLGNFVVISLVRVSPITSTIISNITYTASTHAIDVYSSPYHYVDTTASTGSFTYRIDVFGTSASVNKNNAGDRFSASSYSILEML